MVIMLSFFTESPLIASIFPALFLGLLNGWYWAKQGYSRFQYSFYGAIVSFGFIITILKYIRENF